MQIDTYIKGLLPTIAREDILAKIADISRSIDDDTLPPLMAAKRSLSKHVFIDPFLKQTETKLKKALNSSYKGNFIDIVARVMGSQKKTLDVVASVISKHEGRTIARSAITYQTLQAMKIMDTVDFLNKYTRTLLIYTLAVETSAMRTGHTDLRLSKAQLRSLKEKIDVYISALSKLSFTDAVLKGNFESIPSIEVDEVNMKEQLNMMGRSTLDPGGVFSDGLVFQTVYPIRRMLADWQENSRQAAIEERKLLEYQIMDLKAAVAGENDPKVQRHLEYSEQRMRDLNQKIQKMEE